MRRAVRSDAARDHFAFRARDYAAAHGTFFRKAKSFLFARAARFNHLDDLRNYLAALLNQNPVAQTHAKTFDLIFVVKRSARYRCSREQDGLKVCYGRERARSSDLNDD